MEQCRLSRCSQRGWHWQRAHSGGCGGFCDLRGYTAFTETAGPEEVLDFQREYHGALGPLVTEFEGTSTISLTTGHGVLQRPSPLSGPG
jgi:hypothetical protein